MSSHMQPGLTPCIHLTNDPREAMLDPSSIEEFGCGDSGEKGRRGAFCNRLVLWQIVADA